MNVLIVTPVDGGSGETVTARYLGRSLVQRKHCVHFVASSFASRFLVDEFPDEATTLGSDGPENARTWWRLQSSFRPDAIVFADYPLMFLPNGVPPLGCEPEWEERLCDLDTCLVTLDHCGFAQREMGLFLGTPHLFNTYYRFKQIPSRMKILLPCPMHEPGSIKGRRGQTFRYWDVPLTIPSATRSATRRRLKSRGDDLMVLHIVSTWSWQSAESFGLSYYRHLGALLHEYLAPMGRRVKVVSLNNGSLLEPINAAGVEIVNIGQVTPPEFDRLLHCADLLLTENRASISMGKAVCALRPAAVLKNSHGVLDLIERCEANVRRIVLAMERDRPGSVFPFESYPTDLGELLDEVVLNKESTLTRAVTELEVFGGSATAARMARLLIDEDEREAMRSQQRIYVDRLGAIADGATVLEAMVG